MTADIALILVAAVILLLIAAYFSAAETSLTATSRARMHQLEKEGVKRAAIVSTLIADRERLLGAILLGNNLVNILASALTTSVLIYFFGTVGVAIATVVMTALVLVFGEVLPKTLAITHVDRVALAVAAPIKFLVATVGPVLTGVRFIVRRTLHLFGIDVDAAQPVLSAHEELRGTIEIHHLEGQMVREDKNRIGGLLDLEQLEVADVMVHRKNMTLINVESPPADIIREVLASPHTRVPFWRGDAENIVGVLHVRDLLRAMHQAGGDTAHIDIAKLLSEPWFVPETTTLTEQLDAFLKRRGHLALVVDEYGALMGLVTLEDILEEIFGDIRDEHDVTVSGVRPQADGTVVVDGWVPIRDLNRAMAWELPDEEATTIAGLVIHQAQAIPDVGQVFSFYGFKFEIQRRQRNQIMSLRITPPKRTEPEPNRLEL